MCTENYRVMSALVNCDIMQIIAEVVDFCRFLAQTLQYLL